MSKTPNETFARRLNLLMFQKDITEQRLADSVGVARSAIAKWKKGHVPNGYKIFLAARFFDVKESFFFDEPLDFQI